MHTDDIREAVTRLVNTAVRDVIELECAALGDHCLPTQLEEILYRLLIAAQQPTSDRLAALEARLEGLELEALEALGLEGHEGE